MKKLAILNCFSVLLATAVSYLGNAMAWNGNTVGGLSEQYSNLFTPAGYAFSIWGLIFISLFAYSFFQIKAAFSKDGNVTSIAQTGYWFFLANVLNAAWIVAWFYEFTGLSVLIMLGILFSLIMVIIRTRMELWDAPLRIIAFTWWPICLFSGWISVATFANVAAYLSKIAWDGWGISETTWTLITILLILVINILIISRRNMREFALVTVWAFVAIFSRHIGNLNALAYAALAAAIILFLHISYHAYQNRDTAPF